MTLLGITTAVTTLLKSPHGRLNYFYLQFIQKFLWNFAMSLLDDIILGVPQIIKVLITLGQAVQTHP